MIRLDQALGIAVTVFLSHRSRSVPSLRPAARAIALYAAADLVRLGIDVWGREGWRGWAWIDVCVWCGMTGVWCAVLAYVRERCYREPHGIEERDAGRDDRGG